MIEYKKLPTKRWKEFKDIRLEALKHDWIAFGVAYDDEMNFSEKEWKEKIKNIIFVLNDYLTSARFGQMSAFLKLQIICNNLKLGGMHDNREKV